MQATAKIEKDAKGILWIKCRGCGHKLARIMDSNDFSIHNIEFKCHSCKTANITKMMEVAK